MKLEFKYVNDRGDMRVKRHTFEGILNNLNRRYHETDSNSVREELSKYISNKCCSSCGGARLKTEARHVFINDTSLPEIVEMSIFGTMAFFQSLNLTGQRAQIAEKILKRNWG